MSAKLEKVPFEKALSLSGFGKYNVFAFLLCGSIMTGMVFETFSVAYLVPASACELNTTNSQQGLMAAVPLIGILATSHIGGYLADTRGRKNVMICSLLLGFVTGASATFSTNWIMFSILKLLSSSALAAIYALAVTLLSESMPEEKRFIMVILTTSLYLISTGTMAVLTIPILPLEFSYNIPYLNINFNSWRLLNFIYTLPCLIGIVGLLLIFESPKYLMSVGKEDMALEVLSKIYAINSGKDASEFAVKSLTLDEDQTSPITNGFWSSVKQQTLPLVKPPLLKNTILISTLFVIVYFSMNPLMVWLPYMADGIMQSIERGEKGLTFCEMLRATQNSTRVEVEVTDECALNKVAMMMVFGSGCILAILNLVYSSFISYVGRKPMLIMIQFISGIAGLCVNFCDIWILTIILILVFISGMINFGFLSTFSVDIFPTYVKAMAVCVTLMVGRGSAVLSINIMKLLLADNCETVFYLFGGIAIFGGLLAFLLPSENGTKKKCPEI